MITNCPKCNTKLSLRYDTPSKYREPEDINWCEKCRIYFTKRNCVSCDEVYYSASGHSTGYLESHNHKCSEEHEKAKERGQLLADKWETGELYAKKTKERRLYDGLELLEKEEIGDTYE